MESILKNRIYILEKELEYANNKLECITRTIRFIHNKKVNNNFHDLLEQLLRLKYKCGEIFTLKDVYNDYEEILKYYNPNNNTIKASIRANLQYLRDKEKILFISRGVYKFK